MNDIGQISVSRCCSSFNIPGRSECRSSEPSRTPPTRSGNPNTARTPASTAGAVNDGQRVRERIVEIRFEHGKPLGVRIDTRALSQRQLQLLDARPLTGFTVSSERPGAPSAIRMMPAPLSPVTSAQVSHSRCGSNVGARLLTTSATIRSRRLFVTEHGPGW